MRGLAARIAAAIASDPFEFRRCCVKLRRKPRRLLHFFRHLVTHAAEEDDIAPAAQLFGALDERWLETVSVQPIRQRGPGDPDPNDQCLARIVRMFQATRARARATR